MTFEEALPAIKDWLSQHGVNPDDVPRGVAPTLLAPDGAVWLPLFARNEAGAKLPSCSFNFPIYAETLGCRCVVPGLAGCRGIPAKASD